MQSSTLLYKDLQGFYGGLLVVIARNWTRSKPCFIGSWLLLQTFVCQVIRSYFVPTHSTQRKNAPHPLFYSQVFICSSNISSGASKMLQIMEWNTLYRSMSPLCSRTAIDISIYCVFASSWHSWLLARYLQYAGMPFNTIQLFSPYEWSSHVFCEGLTISECQIDAFADIPPHFIVTHVSLSVSLSLSLYLAAFACFRFMCFV